MTDDELIQRLVDVFEPERGSRYYARTAINVLKELGLVVVPASDRDAVLDGVRRNTSKAIAVATAAEKARWQAICREVGDEYEELSAREIERRGMNSK